MAKSTSKKKAETPAVIEVVTMNIRTNGAHDDYLDWALDQMPEPYGSKVVSKTETGYTIQVYVEEDGSNFFVCRYLATLAAEIRTLDEGNVTVQKMPVTALTETEE